MTKINRKKWHKCAKCEGRIYDHKKDQHQCKQAIPPEMVGSEYASYMFDQIIRLLIEMDETDIRTMRDYAESLKYE